MSRLQEPTKSRPVPWIYGQPLEVSLTVGIDRFPCDEDEQNSGSAQLVFTSK
jgi:hypothetical protein